MDGFFLRKRETPMMSRGVVLCCVVVSSAGFSLNCVKEGKNNRG